MMYSQGDILIISVPFTDLTSQKKRPVLVLSNNHYNTSTDDIVVVAITSKIDNKPYNIPLSNNNLEKGMLVVDSYIRTDKIYTLSQNIVIKKFGEVKDDILKLVKDKVIELLKNK